MKTLNVTKMSLLTLTLMFSSFALAGSEATERQSLRLNLVEQLNLSEEQKEAFNAILNEEQQAQLEALRAERIAQRQEGGQRDRKAQRGQRNKDCSENAVSRSERQEKRQERRQSNQS